MTRTRTWVAVIAATVLAACTFGAVLPGSRPYQPLPKWEARFFQQARRDVFPSQVREQPDAWAGTVMAWTGVIVGIEYRGEGADRSVRIMAEHRYFDWIEDHGIQRERYFLSPRGDGRFAVFWGVGTPGDRAFIDQFAVGDMLVAYGRPSFIRPDCIGLDPTLNMRAIKPDQFRTDVLDYGKPGEPVNQLKTPS